ncbi:glycerophosphodiester phosphodiesterase family protein [Paenibacillus qinlingensis]|uniref:glycerophosphodiester phosphodiesterase family protein n=1 Tax=Paenibacillus qinlingensis TaxID=1837343 RepID=UPI0015664078|nr:glycerophosphodiester phosphodiesterase family protein [Paenibacillus qinlingensis]NQX60278.1 S-layer homology domain-containing protein [Paenibacillus qinlingensis]
MKRYKKVVNRLIIAALVASFVPHGFLPSQQAYAADDNRNTLNVRKTVNAPVIDGKLDESLWSISQSLTKQTGSGTFKDSKFGMLWDNKYLYIGVKADDDNLTAAGSGNWFDQDNINFFLDPTMHQSTPYAADDMQLGFVYQADSTSPEFHFGAATNGQSSKDSNKILRAIQKTATGWSLETAIPWDMLKMDPNLTKKLGLEIGVTDRYGTDVAQQRNSYWSAFQSSSFWNDTTGFGVINLIDSNPVTDAVSPVLLDENFDAYPNGTIPYGWISDVNAGSPSFTVVQDTYGNGRMTFDGKASGKQGRIVAPVQWDNYTVEADVKFESVLDSARWASLMFRVPSTGKVPYNQMAIRQNGTYEFAYRKADGNWYSPTPISGSWRTLTVNSDYTMKVRIFGSNVKEYMKAKSDPSYTMVTDTTLPTTVVMGSGKVGLQVDQSKVSFDNLKVTRITADRLDLVVPSTVEALTGPISVTGSVYYSDGITEAISNKPLKYYTSDESIIKVSNNALYPMKAGRATVRVIYENAEYVQEVTVTPSTVPLKVSSLKHDDGYFLATVNQPLSLSTITFKADFNDFTSGTITGNELDWTSSSSSVVVSNGNLNISQKGVYTLTAQKDGVSISMLVVAKEAADSEYVLYEENFDQLTDGTLPAGWSRKEGTTASKAVVKAGGFELDAAAAPDNPSRVLLPDYLGTFGNYKIEADVTHLQANDAARWHSIMYRIQNNDYPYYQMAVRKDATSANGVEFAERTAANAWNVMDTGAFTEAIDPSKMYHYTVKAFNNRVMEMINDKVVVDTDNAGSYAKGRIGLQSNGSKMRVDNIRVTLQRDALPLTATDRYANVTEPTTQIAMASTIVTEVTQAADLSKWSDAATPATAILHVNNELKVTNPTGEVVIGDAAAILDTFGTKTMPAFYVKDESTVDNLITYLKDNRIEDVFVMSSNGDLVKKARLAYPIIRGIVDFSAMTSFSQEQLLEIRQTTNASLAHIAVLPQKAATKANTDYLQMRTIMVWAKDEAAAAGKNLSMHTLITAGVNGIVTDTPAAAFTALSVYNQNKTMIRKPYIIGHRGLPSAAPENTIESNRLALDNGADFIENDVYISKDGYLVIHHDGELSGTTNGTGNIENYTLAEIKALNANKPHPTDYPDVKIPTLEEQIDLVQQRGKMIMNEIKTSTPAAIDAFVQLIKDKNAEADIDNMSFVAAQILRTNSLMPTMPSGLLSSLSGGSSVKGMLRTVLSSIQPLNATFNNGYGGISQGFMEAAKHRGILISPWTLNDRTAFNKFFLNGAWGLTTDYANWAADMAAAIKPEKLEFTFEKNETVPIQASMTTYKGDTATISPEVIFLDGQNSFEVNGNEVTSNGKGSGVGHALLRYTYTMNDGNKYDLYTQPITLSGPSEPTGPTGPTDPTEQNPGSTDGSAEVKDPTFNVTDAMIQAAIQQSGANNKLIITIPLSEKKNQAVAIFSPAAIQTVLSAAKNHTVAIQTELGSYELNLSSADLQAWAKKLGTEQDKLNLTIQIKLNEKAVAEATATGKDVKKAIDFTLTVGAEEGKSTDVSSFQTFIARSIRLDAATDTKALAAVREEKDANGHTVYNPVPFVTRGNEVVIFSRTNSTYLLIANPVAFGDLNNHWSKQTVEAMANKWIVQGVGASSFAPDRQVTRAEFAALLVRSFGLSASGATTASFKDVKASDWFAAPVSLAAEYGLVGGYEDHTFRPDAPISRQEMAVMINRAIQFAGYNAALQSNSSATFSDEANIAEWAKDAIRAASALHIINGRDGNAFSPLSTGTRAESAVMLSRMLQALNFSN